MDMPFASYWKIQDGLWFWYYNKDAAMRTPFGDAKPAEAAKPGGGPTSLPTPQPISIEKLQSALKIDRTRIELTAGKAQEIHVTNTLPGPASLSVACPYRPLAQTGISAAFDKSQLKASETAVLTLTVDPSTPAGIVPVQISVAPTNQVLNLTVNISR
jgi:hypothetical protein